MFILIFNRLTLSLIILNFEKKSYFEIQIINMIKNIFLKDNLLFLRFLIICNKFHSKNFLNSYI